MAKEEILPTSPLTLTCPYCKAEPGHDCETSSGRFAVVHVARVKAAAVIDTKNSAKRGGDFSQAAARTVKKAKERE